MKEWCVDEDKFLIYKQSFVNSHDISFPCTSYCDKIWSNVFGKQLDLLFSFLIFEAATGGVL